MKLLLRKTIEETKGNNNITLLPEQDAHFVVIIDEIGLNFQLARAVCSAGFDMSQALWTELSHCADNKEERRVEFIVTGTGASAVSIAFGSLMDQFSFVALESAFELRKVMFNTMLDSIYPPAQFPPGNDCGRNMIEQRLTPFSSASPPSPGHSPLQLPEEASREFMSNARCMSLLLKFLADQDSKDFKIKKDWHSSVPAFRNLMIPAQFWTTNQYFSLNGLSECKQPNQVLMLGLAVALHQLPFLPSTATISGEIFGEKMQGMLLSLMQALVAKGGILTDRAVVFEEKIFQQDTLLRDSSLILNQFIPEEEEEKKTNVKKEKSTQQQEDQGEKVEEEKVVLQKIVRTSAARFHFSPAFLAMLRHSAGLVLNPRGWAGLEKNTRDFGALTIASSASALRLIQMLEKEKQNSVSNFYAARQNHPLLADPLHALKQRLLLYNVDGVAVLTPTKLQSSVQLINPSAVLAAQRKTNELDQLRIDAFNRAYSFFTKISENLDAGRGVVVESSEMEQASDLFFIGPGFVDQIQNKEKSQGRGIDYVAEGKLTNAGEVFFGTELIKMNFVAPDARFEAMQTTVPNMFQINAKTGKYHFFFRDLWISAMLHAASPHFASIRKKKRDMEEEKKLNEMNRRHCSRKEEEEPISQLAENSDFLSEFRIKNQSSWDSTKINNYFTGEFAPWLAEKRLAKTYTDVSMGAFFVVECSSAEHAKLLQKEFKTCTITSEKFTQSGTYNNKPWTWSASYVDQSQPHPQLITVVRPRGDASDSNIMSSPFYPIPMSTDQTNASMDVSALLDGSSTWLI